MAAFPITLDGQGLHVAFTDPLNPQLAEDLRFGLGKSIVPVVARRSQVQALIDKHYGSGRAEHRGDFRPNGQSPAGGPKR
jgi:type IV pilus assembly protein PilB